MELYHLKTFVAVAQESHLTRAARQLNTSQPAVSAHIKALENELDLQLFTRTPKGMALTQAGVRLKVLALKTLESVSQIEAQAKVIKNELTGVLRVGLHVDPEFLRLERLFSICRSDFPGIEFHLSQSMSWEALEAVESKALDCAFVYGEPDSNRVGALHLKKIPVKLAMPPAWKKKAETVSWEDIGALPWITTPPECAFHHISQNIFNTHGLKPVRIAVADEESVLSRLVMSGAGVTLMIKDEADQLEADGKIAVWEQELPPLTLSFIFHQDQVETPVIQAMIQAVSMVWEKDC